MKKDKNSSNWRERAELVSMELSMCQRSVDNLLEINAKLEKELDDEKWARRTADNLLAQVRRGRFICAGHKNK